VILGTVAVEQPQLVAELCQEFPGQIVVGIDALDEWQLAVGWKPLRFWQPSWLWQMQELGAAAITDIHRMAQCKDQT